MFQYFLIYKPFNMLSQFSREGDHQTLADLGFTFAKDIYPVGRLDADSEGLLLLTNDNFLKTKLLEPRNRHTRTYYVQVEGEVTDEACRQLSAGVSISINGKQYKTLPAEIAKIAEPELPERNPPIRFRKNIPTSWLSVTLREGKNRQVRRMTAAVGFPTLRLVRWSIGKISLADKKINFPNPGDVWEVTPKEAKLFYERTI
ncbi:pseudouridine synthase [Dyadobacter fermentans]|uniref:Pseudouridine synthase n=1 Tax=Dyadobacter fermentans (strain ATCC 700827 / DSM 18053 / CIP 107007 / KCTC 52180 / NS114) TaxID=471854 RepID=C6W5I1_DYAFD|nr:pseudouridine synthase [Dyadobacter fermentans]ACT94199.1 pseudouridine synthase [Dyadobacter fermentans DSM 18053]